MELILLPERAARPGRPGRPRAAFAPSPAARIVSEEGVWADDEVVVTPNRFPFAERQMILWSRQPRREPDEAFLLALMQWAHDRELTAMVNSIGAAASIPRAHAHVTPEHLMFLDALPRRALSGDWLPDIDDVEFLAADVPICWIGIRGDPAARAHAAVAVQERRMTPSCSMVVHGDTTWIVPRSAAEVPHPHFPHAVGAAELWGRWCYMDERAFEEATGQDLERALLETCCAPLPE